MYQRSTDNPSTPERKGVYVCVCLRDDHSLQGGFPKASKATVQNEKPRLKPRVFFPYLLPLIKAHQF